MDSNKAIDMIGGTAAAARFFEVRMPTISKWRHTGLPKARLMYLRDVRPDVYAAAQKVGAGGTSKQLQKAA